MSAYFSLRVYSNVNTCKLFVLNFHSFKSRGNLGRKKGTCDKSVFEMFSTASRNILPKAGRKHTVRTPEGTK